MNWKFLLSNLAECTRIANKRLSPKSQQPCISYYWWHFGNCAGTCFNNMSLYSTLNDTADHFRAARDLSDGIILWDNSGESREPTLVQADAENFQRTLVPVIAQFCALHRVTVGEGPPTTQQLEIDGTGSGVNVESFISTAVKTDDVVIPPSGDYGVTVSTRSCT
jgi:hypothetical protein